MAVSLEPHWSILIIQRHFYLSPTSSFILLAAYSASAHLGVRRDPVRTILHTAMGSSSSYGPDFDASLVRSCDLSITVWIMM
ncbi:hypothetical protein BT63DRAFT_423997, partial [Microthyrium microscopicum]